MKSICPALLVTVPVAAPLADAQASRAARPPLLAAGYSEGAAPFGP